MARFAPDHRLPRARPAGFSLVELMVAMLIGMIGSIVIFQVFAVFESQKRTTTSGGDAQQNGLLALSSIERDARMAGYGINGYPPLLGCTVSAYDSTRSPNAFTFPLVPMQITPGAGIAPASIQFVYSTSGNRAYPVRLTANVSAGQTNQLTESSYGYRVGDVIVIGQINTTPPPCVMRLLTTTTVNTDTRIDNVGGQYNDPAGPSAFSAWDNTALNGGRIFNLGSTLAGSQPPGVVTYAITNNQLTYLNLITGGAPAVIADGIVQLQAQYGNDANNDGIIQPGEWQTATPANWAQVLALRAAIVARSAQPERPDPVSGACNTTASSLIAWAGGNIDISGTDPSWACYRYRVFETRVPLRNFIWLPTWP